MDNRGEDRKDFAEKRSFRKNDGERGERRFERSDNFKKIGWGVVTIVAVLSCLYLLSLAVISIGPGVAYSILAGVGAIGTVIAGILLYKDPMNAKKVLYISLIVIGVIGVRLTSGGI